MTPSPIPPPQPPASPTGEPVLGFLANPKVAISLYIVAVIAFGFSLGLGPDLPPQVMKTIALVAFVVGTLGQLGPGARKPPPGANLVVAAIAAALLLTPGPAAAQVHLNVGPSIPAFAISPGSAHPAQIAAGAGFTVGADFFETELLNQKAHWLTVGLDFYGSVASADKGVAGNAVVALHACLLGLFCVGPGMKLLDSTGYGALDGKLDHRSFLVMIEPDCRVMKLLWPLLASAPPAEAAPPDVPRDGDHPDGVAPTGAAK